MIYITRNYEYNSDDKKAFDIYSDYDCKKLEFSCNYYQMIETLQNSLDELLANGVITYEEAWAMRDDYVAYNEIVEMYSE